MKKMVFLFLFLLFFTTGCYDYTELNKIAIVSGISIDYKEDSYQIAYEILNTKNKDDSPNEPKVYLAKGEGSSISEAFYNVGLETAKTPYLAHLKTIVLSEEVAKNHMKDIIDYFIRDNYIRNIFLLVVAKDTSAYEILEHSDTNNPVVSTAIKDLIENTTYKNNIASSLNFEKFTTNILDKRKDSYLSSIEIRNGKLALGPLGIFSGYEMKTFISEEESATFNLLNGTSKENQIQIACPNDSSNFIIFSSYHNPKSSIEVDEKNVKIKTELEVKIVENHCNYNFKEIDTYTTLEQALNKKVAEDLQKVFKTFLQYQSDVLKIEELYYKKYKKEIDFTLLQYQYDAKVIINRNGLIFEVER